MKNLLCYAVLVTAIFGALTFAAESVETLKGNSLAAVPASPSNEVKTEEGNKAQKASLFGLDLALTVNKSGELIPVPSYINVDESVSQDVGADVSLVIPLKFPLGLIFGDSNPFNFTLGFNANKNASLSLTSSRGNTSGLIQPGGWAPPTAAPGWPAPTAAPGWPAPTTTPGWQQPTTTSGWQPPTTTQGWVPPPTPGWNPTAAPTTGWVPSTTTTTAPPPPPGWGWQAPTEAPTTTTTTPPGWGWPPSTEAPTTAGWHSPPPGSGWSHDSGRKPFLGHEQLLASAQNRPNNFGRN